jgi:hypothetical protein
MRAPSMGSLRQAPFITRESMREFHEHCWLAKTLMDARKINKLFSGLAYFFS